ncbi:MAG TPA: hypothetical protein VHY20_15815 [Pirellulales bacterium]|jgi:hypothetical protein|nr:hypothetical protein [Pirellulales bacterium]
MKTNWLLAGSLTFAGALVVALCAGPAAHARPAYKAQIEKVFPDNAAIKEAKCNTCHEGTEKKNRNDFGKAFGKTLNAKNSKDTAKIDAALEAVAGQPSAISGKTFGDLIKEGKLPNSK